MLAKPHYLTSAVAKTRPRIASRTAHATAGATIELDAKTTLKQRITLNTCCRARVITLNSHCGTGIPWKRCPHCVSHTAAHVRAWCTATRNSHCGVRMRSGPPRTRTNLQHRRASEVLNAMLWTRCLGIAVHMRRAPAHKRGQMAESPRQRVPQRDG